MPPPPTPQPLSPSYPAPGIPSSTPPPPPPHPVFFVLFLIFQEGVFPSFSVQLRHLMAIIVLVHLQVIAKAVDRLQLLFFLQERRAKTLLSIPGDNLQWGLWGGGGAAGGDGGGGGVLQQDLQQEISVTADLLSHQRFSLMNKSNRKKYESLFMERGNE